MSLNKTNNRFRINLLIFVIEAFLPLGLLFALQQGWMLLSGIIFAILLLGIIYLVVFK